MNKWGNNVIMTGGILLLLAMLLSVPGSRAADVFGADAPEIHLACTSFPPWKISKSASKRGIDVDIIDEAFDRAGLRLKTSFLPWKRSYADTLNGKYDGLCGCSWNEEREALFTFSAPVSTVHTGYFVKKGNRVPFNPVSPDPSLRIGVVRGYVQEQDLQNRDIPHDSATGNIQLVRMLAADRLDVIYSFKAPVLWHASRQDPVPVFDFIEQSTDQNYICFDRQNTRIKPWLPAINEALLYMQRSGRSDAIGRSYQ